MKTDISKTLNSGKLLMILLLFATSIACNQQQPEDTKEVAEDRNDEKFENNKSESDAQFLVNASEINLMEIKLSELAERNAVAAETKELSKMMMDQHNKNQEELKNLAASKSISIPVTLTDEGEDKYKKLMDKKGNDFDKEYCDFTVSGHRDAIEKFEKASTDSQDPDIKNWATTTLPALRNHLDHALTCQTKMK